MVGEYEEPINCSIRKSTGPIKEKYFMPIFYHLQCPNKITEKNKYWKIGSATDRLSVAEYRNFLTQTQPGKENFLYLH